MRPAQVIRLVAIFFLAGAVLGLPLIPGLALARGFHGGGGGFGGFHGGGGGFGGFSGGSFRPDAVHPRFEPGPERPRPDWGRRPDVGPDRPRPDRPDNINNVNVDRNVNVTGYGGGWGPYYGGNGGGWGAAAAGAVTGLAVGAMVGSLAANAQPMEVNNQTYYYDGQNYYQPCYQGSDSGYCVVSDPN